MSAGKRKPSEPILSAHGIVNRFGKQVVHDKIDLDVRSGEILGIAGGSAHGRVCPRKGTQYTSILDARACLVAEGLLDTSRARRGGFERLEGRGDYNLKARAA